MRVCTFEGAVEIQTPEYDRAELAPGHTIEGPAIVTDAFSTIVLPPEAPCKSARAITSIFS